MSKSYQVYIEEVLDLEEGWIRELLIRELASSISITNRFEKAILMITFCSNSSRTEYSEEYLKLRFSGHNLSLFEEKQDGVFNFKSPDELKSLIPSIKKFITLSSYSLEKEIIKKSNECSKNLNQKIGSELYRTFESQYIEILNLNSTSELSDYFRIKFPTFDVKNIFEFEKSFLDRRLFCISRELKLFLISQSEDDVLTEFLLLSAIDLVKKIKTIENKFQKKETAHIFKSLPYAVTIYDKKSHHYNHNTCFTKLGVTTRQLDSVTNNQTLDLHEIGKYKIVKKDIGYEYSILSLIEIKDFEINFSDQSHEELGIVSSSIAHELNNPLGGVLAALDVLLLDDNSLEIAEKFNQMKQGVQRCKELVETFLSFSRKDQTSTDSEVFMGLIVEQVIQLSRFRLIESNNQLKINYIKLNDNSFLRNSHLLTMCFYLIVGELLTVKSRETLIQQSSFSEMLELEIIEDSNYILISMENELPLSKDFLVSKLFNYLLDTLEARLIEVEGAKKLYFS